MTGSAKAPRVRGLRWRSRVGLAIDHRSIRAVGVHDHVLDWAIEEPIEDETELSARISAVLARVPRSRLGLRPVVVAAIGPSRAQMKPLTGLPPVRDPRLVAEVVRESASRFFLSADVPLVTGSADVAPSGELWGAAYERPTVDAIRAACHAAGYPVLGIVPTPTILPFATDDAEIRWGDGDVEVTVTIRDCRPTAIRRGGQSQAAANGVDSNPMRGLCPVPRLSALGDGCERFADAYGAAVVPPGALILTVGRAGGSPLATRVTRLRATAAFAACVAGVLAVALAPGIAANRAESTNAAELAALDTVRREATAVARNLVDVTGALNEVARFAGESVSPLALVARLTQRLPDGTALVTFRFDSAGGSVVALAPRAGLVLSHLDSTGMVTSPEIVGPVTREASQGREFERATIRFGIAALRATSVDFGVSTDPGHRPAVVAGAPPRPRGR